METITTTARNTSLEDLVAVLTAQQEVKRDIVVPVTKLRSVGGRIQVPLPEPVVTDEGVTQVLDLDPSQIFDTDVSARFDIPRKYVEKLRGASRPRGEGEGHLPWVALSDSTLNTHFDASQGRVLVRCFASPDGTGTARCMNSDRFAIMDNLDVVLAGLQGISDSGVSAEVQSCDLSEHRMRVRIYSPEVHALAPKLLEGYRTPFEGPGGGGHGQAGLRDGDGNLPVVFAGFELSNSETGGGALTVTPRMVVKICNNGAVITEDVVRKVHLGGRLDGGVVRYSADTFRKNRDLVRATVRDTVATFLDREYVESKIEALTEKAGSHLTDPVETIEMVSSALKFSDAERESILSCFIKSGQVTSGGVMQAVTAASQTIEDPDRAAAVEASGVRAMELAFAR